jgi:hypothetical protein
MRARAHFFAGGHSLVSAFAARIMSKSRANKRLAGTGIRQRTTISMFEETDNNYVAGRKKNKS